MWWVKVGLFLALFGLPSSQSEEGGVRRNGQWLEETIDEFLRNAQNTDEAADIQVSTCRISSQQLVATAQATAARVLKGVCNPTELGTKFQELEERLTQKLSSFTDRIEQKLTELDAELRANQRRLMTLLSSLKGSGSGSVGTGGGSVVVDDRNEYTPAYIPSVSHRAEEVITPEEDDNDASLRAAAVSPKSSGPAQGGQGAFQGQGSARWEEISRYNSTVHIENGKRVFSFYWLVSGMSYKMGSWGQKRVLRSNSFYIFPRGYRMYLKLVPRYSATTMYLFVGLSKGDYDGELEWPFRYKMRVQVLDQQEGKSRAQDLKSRIWDPKELCSASNWGKPLVGDNDECVGLGFPHGVVQTGGYIRNDGIVVKLTVHLE